MKQKMSEESVAVGLFGEGNFFEAKRLFENLLSKLSGETERRNCLFNIASCEASLGNLHEALDSFSKIGDQTDDIVYCKALCEYRLANYGEVQELLSKLNDDNAQLRALVVNLKSAAQYKLELDSSKCKETLDRLEIEDESKFDCVTLHNYAIYEFIDPSQRNDSIDKLCYLAKLTPKFGCHPNEIYYNNLLAHLMLRQPEGFDAILRDMGEQMGAKISKLTLEYLQIVRDDISTKQPEATIRKLESLIQKLILEDSAELERRRFLQVVFSHLVSLLWHSNQYEIIEKLCEKYESNLDLADQIKVILVNSLFMQDTRFEECVTLFEDFLPKSTGESLLSIDPVILGNLCVSYVLTGRNHEAERLIKDVEQEELQVVDEFGLIPEYLVETLQFKKFYNYRTRATMHLATINAIIGTLYCVKNNHEFGLNRMFKSMRPLKFKLDYTLWFYLKRCILCMLDSHCNQMIYMSDDLFNLIIGILIQCEQHGAEIYPTNRSTFDICSLINDRSPRQAEARANVDHKTPSLMLRYFSTVAQEARYCRSLVLPLVHD